MYLKKVYDRAIRAALRMYDDLIFGFVWRVRERPKLIMGCFVEICRRGGLKVNAGKTKVIVLWGGEEGLECEICMDGGQLEKVLVKTFVVCFG